MTNFLYAFCFIPILLINSTLSLAPFLQVLSRKKKLIIFSVYALLLCFFIGGFYRIALAGKASFSLIKHGLFLGAILTTILHILVLPRYIREWIFSSALSTLFYYLIGAVSAYLTYCYYGWDCTEAYICMELISSIFIVFFYVPIRHLLVKSIRPLSLIHI